MWDRQSFTRKKLCAIGPALEMAIFATYKRQQTMLKNRKDLIFYRKCNPKSLLTALTLASEPSIKHGVLGGYFLLKNENAKNRIKTVQAAFVTVAPFSELMRAIFSGKF